MTPRLKVKVLTLFPEMFPGALAHSISGKALEKGLWSCEAVNIRDYAKDRHKTVDDTVYGGGHGMLMKPDVVADAIAANHKEGALVYMTPRGVTFTQELARDLASQGSLTVLCGHYEGIDQRVIDAYKPLEVSLGDFVLSGGEVAAQVMLDSVVRLVDGVIGKEGSLDEESFEDGLLEYPQYTKPAQWNGRKVPEVLLSGDHGRIREWRREQALEVTKARRPDLYSRHLQN